MATIGVHDNDFFQFKFCIPNLECAKLMAYFKHKHQIIKFSEFMNPGFFTKFYIRKDYYTGTFQKKILQDNCFYGGRAFSEKYIPFDDDIEYTKPDFSCYKEVGKNHLGKKAYDELLPLLNSANIRLSKDEINSDYERLLPQFDKEFNCIVLHDYNFSNIKNGVNDLKKLSELSKRKENGYPIASKFPIIIHKENDVFTWANFTPYKNYLNLYYDGSYDLNLIKELYEKNNKFNICLNVAREWNGENDFFMNGLTEIYEIVTFLKSKQASFLLYIDEEKFVSRELKNLIAYINGWLMNRKDSHTTLYDYLKWYFKMPRFKGVFKKEEVINSFEKVRETNYDVFKQFYRVGG